MKKVFIGIAVLIIVLAIFGIIMMKSDNNSEQSSNAISDSNVENILSNQIEENSTNETEETNISDDSKILIAYFSRADENYSVGTVEVGNTEIMAGFIKDYLGDKADTFKIEPVKAYPTNYKECTEYATEEKNSNARPEFKGDIDISQYDIIFIRFSYLVAGMFQ